MSKENKLTKLEQFVWDNPGVSLAEKATQTNRSLRSIEQAFDRACEKIKAATLAREASSAGYHLCG